MRRTELTEQNENVYFAKQEGIVYEKSNCNGWNPIYTDNDCRMRKPEPG